MDHLKESLARVNDRIKAACLRVNRDPSEVNLVAVTKYVSHETTQAILNTGVQHIGESKVQDALPKWEEMNGQASWHFIGHLQTNKVKDIIGKFAYIHSLDRESLALEIEKRGGQKKVVTHCFIQVNISGEKTKYGLEPNQVLEFVKKTSNMKYIKICGFMTMAPYEMDSELTRSIFRGLRQLRDECNALGIPHVHIEHLSMGMSNDLEVAIEEGATFIRLGSVLVGKD